MQLMDIVPLPLKHEGRENQNIYSQIFENKNIHHFSGEQGNSKKQQNTRQFEDIEDIERYRKVIVKSIKAWRTLKCGDIPE